MAFRHLPYRRAARLSLAVLTILSTSFVYSLGSAPGVMAGQVTVAWDADSSSGVAGYKVYWGTVSRNYSWYADTAAQTNYTVPSLTPGATYYIAATAYDGSRNESGFSNEVTYTVPSACTYATTPASQSFGPSGGTGSVNVTAGAGCNWTTSNPASWITIASGSSGKGNGTVQYSATQNTDAASRTAGLTVAGTIITISQAAPQTYTLAISTSGSGSGTVMNTPSGTSFVAGTSVTLTATAGANSTFTGWSGACSGTSSACKVTMNSNLSVQASFAQALPSYTLSVTKSGSGSGSVSIRPSGTTFKQGTSVTLTATPNKFSMFSGWSGACSGTSSRCTVTMNSNISVGATFTSTKRYGYAGH